MKVNISGDDVEMENMGDGIYTVNILMRVDNGVPTYSVDIGAFIDRDKKSISLLQGDLMEGDVIRVSI